MSNALDIIPQLNLGTYPSQWFWLAVCLIVLYLFLSRYYVPKIRLILRKRTAYIKKNKSEAEVAEATAASLRNEQNAKLDRMYAEAAAIVNEGIVRAQSGENEARVQARTDTVEILRHAEEKAEHMFEKQRLEIQHWSADMACMMYAKVTGVKPDIEHGELMKIVEELYRELIYDTE